MNTIPRSLRWLLGILIACNVALISFIVLMIWARTQGPIGGDEARWRMPPPAWLRETVPAERQDQVAAVLGRHRIEFRRRIIEVREARRDLVRMLADPELTREELDGGFERLRKAEQASALQAHQTLSEVLIELDPPQRMMVVRQMMQRQAQGARRQRPDER